MTRPRPVGALIADRLAPAAVDVFKRLGYNPTEPQAAFHAAREDDVLFGGAGGPGKTKALTMHGVRACVEYPGIAVLGIVRSIGEIERTFEAKLAEVGYATAVGATWSVGRHELTFTNGSRLKFTYCDGIDDAIQLQGSEWQLILVDERSLIAPSALELVFSRLRSRRGGPPILGIRSASNPGGIGHQAVKARFVDGTDSGANVYADEYGTTVRYIPARLDSNPHIDRVAYERQLSSITDPMRRKALLDGDWSVHVGQAFTQWSEARHVVEPFKVPDSWSRFGAVDYGYRAPWAFLLAAEDEDHRVWLTNELYATEVGETEQARRIVDLVSGLDVSIVADPAMWARRGDAASIADVYLREGLNITEADNNRLAGTSRVHEYLGDAPACRMHRAQGWETCPLLHVFSTLRNFRETFPALTVDERRPEDVDTRGPDHLFDCLKYLLAELADGGPQYLLSSTTTPATFQGFDEHADLRGMNFGPGAVVPPPGWGPDFGSFMADEW